MISDLFNTNMETSIKPIGVGGEVSYFMHRCFQDNQTVSQSMKLARTAVKNGELSSRALSSIKTYDYIRNCMDGFKRVHHKPMVTHFDLVLFHGRCGVSTSNDFRKKLKENPDGIISVGRPIETSSLTGTVSSCFLISSPNVLSRFFNLHQANRDFGWRSKYYLHNSLSSYRF